MPVDQLTQKLKGGMMQVLDVPTPPQLGEQSLLLRNLYSLIRAGTKTSTVNAAQKEYLGKDRGVYIMGFRVEIQTLE